MNDLVVVPPFNYQELDQGTEAFLRQKESNIFSVVHKTSTELGKELKEAQDRLAQHGYGCFEEWYTSLGLKKQSVYNYINYHSLIVQQLDKRGLIESLPKPVVYEIAKPTAPEEIKNRVLSGEITTTKELQEAIKAKKVAEDEVARLKTELAEAKKQVPKVIEKEVTPPDYEQTKQQLKVKGQELDQKNEELLALTRSQILQKDRYLVHDILQDLIQAVGKYKNQAELEVRKLPGDGETYKSVMSCVEMLENTANEMRKLVAYGREVIIDV